MEDPGLEALFVPFYLDMMGWNALGDGVDRLPAVRKAGKAVSPSEIIELLSGHWRPRVVGAWFALMRDDDDVAAAVVRALATSLGYLDSPPLVTAAVTMHAAGALEALATYEANDHAEQWGACGFAAAASEYLGGRASGCAPTDHDRDSLSAMLEFAQQLRTA